MSDVQNSSIADTDTDDVSADEQEQAKTVDVRALGIEPLSTPIPKIMSLYRKFVGNVRTFNDARAKAKDDPKDPVVIVNKRIQDSAKSDNPELVALVTGAKEIVSNVADNLFTSLEKNNGLLTSYVVLQEMKTLLGDVQDNFDYYFARSVQKEKDEQGIVTLPSEDAVTDKLTAVKLRSLIENRINIAEAMGEDLPENLFKVSDAGRKSFNTELLPRLPKLDMGDAAPRSFSSTHLSFRWAETGCGDEQVLNVEDGWTLNDVAHNLVSKGSFRISGATVAEMLKKAGHGIGATDAEWKLEFPTGVLFGKKSS